METPLDRAGISIWIEDWTAVGEAIQALRAAGHDPLAHFLAHPDQLEALHRQVMITDVNAAALALTGETHKSALLGPLAAIVPESSQTMLRWIAALSRGDRLYRAESFVRMADGARRDCLVTAVLPQDLAGYRDLLVCAMDIEDYKADQIRLAGAERDIAQASRSSTLGVLTAAIAHEVKGPLAAVVTNAEAALRWLRRPTPDTAEAIAALDALVQDALRARDVVDRTRLLLTNAPPRPEVLALGPALAAAARLVDRDMLQAGATLRLSVAADTPLVLADAIQLQQVLTNLLTNAAQAVSGQQRRIIDLRSQAAGAEALVTITDTGPGIPAADLARIFEPFYSTRPGGMGLGLAICRACIEAHGSRLRVVSAPGEGSSFHFALPTA